MTIPAMAPPESPPPPLCSVPVKVMFAPVATGDMNGSVVVGLAVRVTVNWPEVVGRYGAPAVAPATGVLAKENELPLESAKH